MDFNAIIYAAIGGGGGAALGVFIATLVGRKASEKTRKSVIVPAFTAGLAVLGMNLIPAMYKNMTLPRIIPLNLISGLNNKPDQQRMLVAMKKHEPQYYQKLITVVDKPARNNGSFEEVYNIGAQIGSEMAKDKMKYADAKIIRRSLIIAQDTYAEFKTKAPRQCVNLFYGRPLTIKEDTKSKKLIRDELSLSTLLIELPRTADIGFDAKSAKLTMENLGVQMAEYTTDSDEMDPKKSASLDAHKRMCDIGVFTMSEFIKLEDEKLINVMRYIIND